MVINTADTNELDEQHKLEDPIKVRFTGRLRDRINERTWDYAGKKVDGEWVADPDGDPYEVSQYRCFHRQKTNVVIKTVEEAYSFYNSMGHYASGAGREGITWMNGPMAKAAKRVRREVMDGMKERGYEPAYNDHRVFRGFTKND